MFLLYLVVLLRDDGKRRLAKPGAGSCSNRRGRKQIGGGFGGREAPRPRLLTLLPWDFPGVFFCKGAFFPCMRSTRAHLEKTSFLGCFLVLSKHAFCSHARAGESKKGLLFRACEARALLARARRRLEKTSFSGGQKGSQEASKRAMSTKKCSKKWNDGKRRLAKPGA